MNDVVTIKRIWLITLAFVLIIICPIVAMITATTIYSKNHLYETENYNEWRVHELYSEKWNYCPNCGEELRCR